MARKALIVKANKPPKYPVRKHSRCLICGRSRSVYRIFGSRICRQHLIEYFNQGRLPVANMLTTIRNANMRGYRTCWFDEKNRKIKVDIKYNNQNSRIHHLKKISKPSQHIHLGVEEIKKQCHKRGFYIISTSTGLLTHREALEKNQGGV
ncbi:1298_t:CDS:2 [Funneliformis geosporum]|uniref:1298_t:CDS:1 n=1 Tax=Funneliformis geosporum TaxID=1117311 RepID=A0A9W4S9I1_9GLOM|nr:1298_t:CDS:2 [Funneliformis geosporum]